MCEVVPQKLTLSHLQWYRQDIGSLYDPPPGPRFEGPSVDLNNPVWIFEDICDDVWNSSEIP